MIPWVVFMVVDCVLEVLRENRGSAIVDVNQQLEPFRCLEPKLLSTEKLNVANISRFEKRLITTTSFTKNWT